MHNADIELWSNGEYAFKKGDCHHHDDSSSLALYGFMISNLIRDVKFEKKN